MTSSRGSGIQAGTVLAGKYRVERLLGRGGMGVVVEARHTTLDDRVALKFLLPEYLAQADAAPRFIREARAAVRIKSEHVARVSDVGVLEDGAPYMVMEYLEGTDLAHLIAESDAIAVPDAVDYVVQACDAISEAHRLGIVHRDLKPANLFMARHSDGSPLIKVLDFGISKLTNEAGAADALTRTTATMGSALYMSPEQIRQSRSVDHRTDIYALGITLYELLAKRQPFVAETFAALCVEIATGTPTPLRQLRPDIPAELEAIVGRAYARDRSDRHQTIPEFVMALAPWAPARSQPIIERIARTAGLIPRAEPSPPASTVGGTQLMESAAKSASAGGATNLTGSKTLPPAERSRLRPALLWLALLAAVSALGIAVYAFSGVRPHASAENDGALITTSVSSQPADAPRVEPKLESPREPAPSATASAEPARTALKTALKPAGASKKPDAPKPAESSQAGPTAPAPEPTKIPSKGAADEVR